MRSRSPSPTPPSHTPPNSDDVPPRPLRALEAVPGWESTTSEDAMTEGAPDASWVSGERAIAINPTCQMGQVIADRYELQSLLGEGGMGRVFSAYDRDQGFDVALKMVSFDKGDRLQMEARFRREIEVLTQLKGPSFVQVYDHAIRPECAYVAMELLRGETLSARLSREGRITPLAALSLLRDIGRPLSEAHGLSLIHRDLKPGNIFFSKSEMGETVRVLDFGIAKDLWLSPTTIKLTRVGTLLGSPHYVSPEQAQSKEMDERSDLWSVGVVLYRCLTGHRPFDGPPTTLILRILTDQPKRPSQLVPSLPIGVDSFFEKALAKRPTERFQDVASMIDAFARAIGETPPSEVNAAAEPATRTLAPMPIRPSDHTQVAGETYESYAARVTYEDRPSDHSTVEIPVAILTGHEPSLAPSVGASTPPPSFTASLWGTTSRSLAPRSLYPRRTLTVVFVAFMGGTILLFVLAFALWQRFGQ